MAIRKIQEIRTAVGNHMSIPLPQSSRNPDEVIAECSAANLRGCWLR
jgi:hypothetical protein